MNDYMIFLISLGCPPIRTERLMEAADAVAEAARKLEAEMTAFSGFFAVPDDAPTSRPRPRTLRDALAANARPAHRPQPQRRIQRRQHR